MVIMTSNEFIKRAKVLASRKTYYKNKYPDNRCYVHTDGRTSADCVNLYKSILSGYDVYNETPGYYQKTVPNTGDCTEIGLLNQCSDVSSDFSKLVDGEPRILYMSKPQRHIGAYIGEVKINNNYYNVIEATTSFGGGIVYSWVDSDGTRRNYKGSQKNCKWEKHGLMTKWVKYLPIEKPKPTEQTLSNVYYVKKGDTLSSIAYANGMSLAKLVSYNPQIKDINKINIGDKIYLSANTKEEYYTVQKGDTLGFIARKFNMSLNKLLGLNPDIKNPNLIHVGDKIRIK